MTEIHKIFDWAETSNKGVLLFVDEADAFLQKRSKGAMSEDVRNALNAFLYRTGEASDKFMIVFASNQPEQFDWAVNDRVDEIVEFKLPGMGERIQIINQYLDKYVVNAHKQSRSASTISVAEDVNEEKINEVAQTLDGLSGRQLSKLAVAWQASAYARTPAIFNAEMMDEVIDNHLQQHVQREAWRVD